MMWRCHLAWIACLVATSALSEPIRSRQGFHATPYGTLALNQGATNSNASRYDIKNYVVIADGEAKLPVQSVYCFVINHYKEDGSAGEFLYTFRIARSYSGVSEPVVRTESRTYTPTTDPRSDRMPDYCLDRGYNVTKVEVQTSSTEGPDFNHKFFFEIPR